MRQSKLFTKTRKESPSDEVSKNAELLIRAGFVHKEMAGSYSYLPLGLRVLNKIEEIVRSEMNAISGQEIKMATLHPSEPWKKTGGWDAIDVLFKVPSRTEKEYTIGQSEEEIVTPIASEYAVSYRDLPLAIYQIGQKYRDELRAKSGIMRGREFTMKDMYSFHTSEEDFNRFYEIAKEAYLRIYTACGLTAKVTEGAGGAFSEKISYEFMVLTDAGEDAILYCQACEYCVNLEISKAKEGDTCPKCEQGKLKAGVASEVGNVFDLGDKYPRALGYMYKNEAGETKYPIMGCYGLGITRLMGVIVEALADDKGMVWPESVAPMKIHILSLIPNNAVTVAYADSLYDELVMIGMEVLYDDRDVRAGEKLADADLIGLPMRLLIGKETLESGKVEVYNRGTGEVVRVTREEIMRMAQGATEVMETIQ